jgi:FixJ family two-component response regulator
MPEVAAAGAVYIVDDDPGVLNSLRFLFETEGFRVETFADGADLLAGPLPCGEDCLLIDFKLGSLDGLELVRRLRERNVIAPVVLITVYEGLEKKAAAVGVYDVLLKPHLEESVVTRVEAAMTAFRGALDLRKTP